MGGHGDGQERSLSVRHLEMIAIGGTIGTGLFVGSGGALIAAGPGGALFSFTVIGFIVFFVVCSLGEMGALIPVSGSFNEYCSRFIDKSAGFTMGWNYWFGWCIALPAQMSSIALCMAFWFPNMPSWIWGCSVLAFTVCINLLGVGMLGEVEFWLSLVKVTAVILFVVVGIITVIRKNIFFSNWRHGQAPFVNGFGGTFEVFLTAFFSYAGAELVGVTAGEAANPEEAIPKAIKGTFWKIFFLYSFAIFTMGLLLPYDNLGLIQKNSPFTLGFEMAGIPGASHVMNLVIVIALLSAAISCLYASSRTLMSLAQEGKAPKIFATTRNGNPVMAMIPSIVVAILSVIVFAFVPASIVFDWLLTISGLGGAVTWGMICVVHLRFRKAYLAQGRKLEDLPFEAPFFPYGDYIAIAGVLIVILGQGVTIFFSPSARDTMTWVKTYIGLLTFPILYFPHKFMNGTKLTPLQECDFSADEKHGEIDGKFDREPSYSSSALSAFEKAYIEGLTNTQKY